MLQIYFLVVVNHKKWKLSNILEIIIFFGVWIANFIMNLINEIGK